MAKGLPENTKMMVESEVRRLCVIFPNDPSHVVAQRAIHSIKQQLDSKFTNDFDRVYTIEAVMEIVEDTQAAFC